MIPYWFHAARIKTLPVSLCPVILGLALANGHPAYRLSTGIVIAVCAIMIQIGTNFFNDYFDWLKGADTPDRVGPARMSQSGAIKPHRMKQAGIGVFAMAFLLGGYLIIQGGWPIALIGILSLFFGVIYTAGPWALAYKGGAEIISFIFFGPVSVIGTYYLQTGEWAWHLGWIGAGIGLIVSALLVVNNVRDRITDAKVGKKTWAVRWGRTASIVEYIMMVYTPIFILDALTPDDTVQILLILTLVLTAMVLTRQLIRLDGAQLNRVLAQTSGYLIFYTSVAVYLLV